MINLKAIGLKEQKIGRYAYLDLMDDINKLEKRQYTKIFGELHKEIDLTDIEFGYIYTPLLPFLNNLKIDRELTVMFYLEGYYYYDDIIPFLEGYTDIENYDTVNTYNYDSNLERVIQYTVFELNNEYYISLEVHNGVSDIRCGYSPLYIFKYEGDMDYINFILNSYTLVINDTAFDIQNGEVWDIEGQYLTQEYEFLDKISNVLDHTQLKIEAYSFEV